MEEKDKNNRENNNKPEKSKKKFNYVLLIEILGIIAFCGLLAETLYLVISYNHADTWCIILLYVIAIMLAMAFFKDTFVTSKKALRNRIILYVCALVVVCLPNLIGEIVLYSTGGYVNNSDVLKLIEDYGGFSFKTACSIRCFADILLVAFLCAILTFIIEMLLKENLKRNAD